MLRLIYFAGLRISEVCGLAWRDMQTRDDAEQATVYGKGGKTRVVLLPAAVWRALVQFRGEAGPDAPVFVSQRKGQLDPSAVHRVVKAVTPAPGCRPTCPPIGYVMLMPLMPSIAARLSTWCKQPSAMPAWRPLGGICTRGRMTARRSTSRFRDSEPLTGTALVFPPTIF